jgi:hypothetical protein
MADAHHSAAASGGNSNPEDIFGELTGLLPVRRRVGLARELGAISLDLRLKSSPTRQARTKGLLQLLLTGPAAVDLALRLAGAARRLEGGAP